jgi:urease accessory protein UreF
MESRIEIATTAQEPLRGDWLALLDQVGLAQAHTDLDSLAGSLGSRAPTSIAALRRFLAAYRDEQLFPRELPAIRDAFQHAARGETRELLALDSSTAVAISANSFTRASHCVGQEQLRRLRPLRDFRVAQRYLSAVESGAAHGWHTLAYGVTLAAFAVPLREGLLHYARATMRSFTENGARVLNLTEADLNALVEEGLQPVGAAVDRLIGSVASPTSRPPA